MTAPARKLSDEDYQMIADMTLAGHSLEQIADSLHTTTRTVSRVRARLGLTRPVVAPPEADWEFAEYLVAEGCPAAEVARTIGATRAAVRRRFAGRFTRANAYLFNEARRALVEAGME